MSGTAWLAQIAASKLVRRAADAGFVQVAHARTRRLDRRDPIKTQTKTLMRLLDRARDTRFGLAYDFASITSVAEYQARVPLREYEAFWKEYWEPTYPRIEGATWPSRVPYYALSSGTTTGSTKFIPVTKQMVRSNKKAALTTMALFRHAYPKARNFTGKFFFLGGSTDLRTQDDGSLAGDLSGIAAKEVLDLVRPYSFPSLELGLIGNWELKMEKLAEQAIREPVTAISGVPSWVLRLFSRIKEISGKSTIAEVWPMLRLVVHGGTSFDPYRAAFEQEIGSDAVKYCEVYPCSEGFIATEDPRYGMLRLIPDHNIFFEFIPIEELGKDRPTRHTLADIELGVQYAIVLSTCAGLWSYLLGDTIRFESRNPPLLRFAGRTKFYLSAFGEHLIQEEVDKAVLHAAKICGVQAIEHHVGPVFSLNPATPGHHRYLIEFRGKLPQDMKEFAKVLDHELIQMNEDYAAHRLGDLTMLVPEILAVPEGGFTQWMVSRGKAGGQNKVPVMDNTGKLTRELVEWFFKR